MTNHFKPDMQSPVIRCRACGELTLGCKEPLASAHCEHCGSTKIECDHPSSSFDPVSRTFVCTSCGKEDRGASRTLARGLQRIVGGAPVATNLPGDELKELLDGMAGSLLSGRH